MSDFVVAIGRRWEGEDLLGLLRRPYGGDPPDGRHFSLTWGALAVLDDCLAGNKNVVRRKGATLAWVGDLIVDSAGFADLLANRLSDMQECNGPGLSVRSDDVLGRLNGAFAVVQADERGIAIVTDPLNYTPVYVGQRSDGTVTSIGTHPDVVALAGDCSELDTVSVGEYLNSGRATFPHTMYANVRQLEPGSIHIFDSRDVKAAKHIRHVKYWSPPAELPGSVSESELAAELRTAFLSAVKDRSVGGRVGVSLSGGLDSRLILAAVPKDVDCVALTFCDQLNREARTARKVATCLGRPWHAMYRDAEYVGNSAVQTIGLTGCESDWVHAHAVGFAGVIESHGVDAFLGGDLVGCFLRAPLATDLRLTRRTGGVLPAQYERVPYEYVDNLTGLVRRHVRQGIVDQILARRRAFYDTHVDPGRGSAAEWLEVYPFSQRPEISTWAAERRLLPCRPVGMDRRLLDVAFKIPVTMKLDNRMFFMAAMEIYGKAARIPCANDGVRPGSGRWFRLAQRARRKLHDRTVSAIKKLGREPRIEHSWHDYQKYWQESSTIKRLSREHGAYLDEFEGTLWKENGRGLLERADLYWRDGFRLLQLAVWRGLAKAYRR